MTALAVPAWHALASCQYTDPDLFYPEADETSEATAVQADQARRVCLGCPVREQCLAYALRAGEKWGVWAGLSERELMRERNRGTQRPVPEILAESDARYFARQDTAIAAYERRLAAERRRRAAATRGLAA